MNLKQIINAEKEVESWGEWKSGNIPKKNFPLSKARVKVYKIGRGTRWRLVSFSCLERQFRLIIQINQAKEQFHAWLGLFENTDTTLLLRLEFHGTHPGWHVHSVCDDLDNIPAGVRVGSWINRIPSSGQLHRRKEFKVTENTAIDTVNRFINLYQSRYELL